MGDETRVQVGAVKKGVEAAGGIVERYMIRMLGPLGRKISQASKAGRIMALLGVVAIVVGVVLIYLNSFFFDTAVTRKGLRIVAIRYEMEGYGIVFLAGVGLLIVGILQRRK